MITIFDAFFFFFSSFFCFLFCGYSISTYNIFLSSIFFFVSLCRRCRCHRRLSECVCLGQIFQTICQYVFIHSIESLNSLFIGIKVMMISESRSNKKSWSLEIFLCLTQSQLRSIRREFNFCPLIVQIDTRMRGKRIIKKEQ